MTFVINVNIWGSNVIYIHEVGEKAKSKLDITAINHYTKYITLNVFSLIFAASYIAILVYY